MTDHDDWAKEDCACGHRRYEHEKGDGRCRNTRMKRVAPDDLPPPIYPEGGDPFEGPVNWPSVDTWPQVEAPCCGGFYDAGLAAAEAGPE